jgi:hypothetical protein
MQATTAIVAGRGDKEYSLRFATTHHISEVGVRFSARLELPGTDVDDRRTVTQGKGDTTSEIDL